MGHCNFSLYIYVYKMSEETTYYQRNREAILHRAKQYHNDHNEVLKERERNKYRELSEEEKNTKREYGRNRCEALKRKQKIKRISRKSPWR